MKKSTLLILLLILIGQLVKGQTASGVLTQIPCNNDGIFTVTTSGFTTPITYTYYVNGTTIVHANVSATTDQLTNFAMDNFGYISCSVSDGSSSDWVQASYSPSFNFNISASSPICPVTTGTLSATYLSGTTGPFSYSWTNKSTSVTYTGNNATVPIGEYTAEITDNTTGCVLLIADSNTSITQRSNVTASISTTKASCTNGTATAVPSGGTPPYTYLWGNGGLTSTISGLSKGYYSLEVTDAMGCKSSYLGANISQDPQITVNSTITNATCLQNDGGVIAFGSGGVPPYTYSWSNGQSGNTVSNISGKTGLTVVATDANGCKGDLYSYVKSSTPITVTYSSTPSSCTAATGSATLSPTGGTAPYNIVWYTSPAASGTSITNVAPGSYGFKVTDAVGCVQTGNAVVSPISSIFAYIQKSNAVCPAANGTATAMVSGSNPPFTYSWSNSATTSQITGLSPGVYTCTITDAVSCSVTKTVVIENNSPISLSISTIPASCKFNKDGSASSTVSGGTPPYTYSYTSGSTTANASNLEPGRYWLTVTDANGCKASRFFWINDAKTTNSCYCTISGNVYVDANTNCVFDASENGVRNIMMHCSGIGYTFTDANGYYSFQVPTGNYTISQQVNAYYPLASCQSNSISVSAVAAANCVKTVDMANVINPIHDLKLVTVNSYVPPVPGYPYQQKVIVTNRGTVTESNIQMGYTHDGQLPFSSATLSSFSSAGTPYAYQVQSGFPSLAPSGESTFLLNYNTPTNIPLATKVVFKDTATSAAPISTDWLKDYSPWDNVNTYETSVIGSYDPNYKEVTPKGKGEEGLVSKSIKEFNYTIHFQNEGTYFARNIVITDQLDSDLDWETFVPGYSEYDYTARISESGLLTFTFEEINLPWKSQYGDALSSALVNYTIERKANLPIGTEITNTANIFFDFNEPIVTNTTLNTLDEGTGIGNNNPNGEEGVPVVMELFPNPASDQITIRINNVKLEGVANLNLVDLTGRVVMTQRVALQKGTTIISQNVSQLAMGTYLTSIVLQNGERITCKLFIQ